MPRNRFIPVELDFMKTKKPKWEGLMHRPTNNRKFDHLLRERSKFIQEVVVEFYAKFPYRDPSVSDPSADTFTQEQVLAFPERVRQWFRNNTRVPGGRAAMEKQGKKNRVHARNLAAQRFHQRVNAIAERFLEEDPSLKRMSAFNRALTSFLEDLQKEEPEAYTKLVQDAEAIRNAPSADWTELSEESLTKLLSDFPSRLLNKVEEHGRALPVHMWCIVAFAVPPALQVSTYTIITPSLQEIRKSSAHELMSEQFGKWIETRLGATATGQIKTADEMVYPDQSQGSRPTLPRVDNIKTVTTAKLRHWLRIYFNYHYLWQGGRRSVPWKAVSEDTTARYVPTGCLPPGIVRLIDPSDMTRAQLEAWYNWLIRGQLGEFPASSRFQFSLIDLGSDKSPLEYPLPITACPEHCRLTWSAPEKLYALRMASDNELSFHKQSWMDLPLARLDNIYAPFPATIKTLMTAALRPEYHGSILTSLIFDIERYGPIHTVDGNNNEELNANIPSDFNDGSIAYLLLHEDLRASCLLEDDPDHTDYALTSFFHYAKTTTRFRHAKSQTWRTGPFGVRWIVAVYFYFACAFSLFETCSDELGTEVVRAFESCNFKRLKVALSNFGDWLAKSLRATIRILKKSFEERANAWRRAVIATHLAYPDDKLANESVQMDTHGIPRSRAALRACYEAIQQKNPDATFGMDNEPVNQTIHLKKRQVNWEEDEFSDRESTEGEEIEIPDFSSEDDSDSSNDETRQAKSTDSHTLDTSSVGLRDLSAYFDREPVTSTAQPDGGTTLSPLTRVDQAERNAEEPSAIFPLVSPELHPTRSELPGFEADCARVDGESESDEGIEALPRRLFADISPMKLKAKAPAGKPRSRMKVEVVIPTPRKSRGSPSKRSSPADVSSDPGASANADIDGPIAHRRGRRSNVRSEQVEKAIRSASKGRYRARD